MTRRICAVLLAAAWMALAAQGCKPKTLKQGEEMTNPPESDEGKPAQEADPGPKSQFAAWDRIRDQIEKFEPYKLTWNREPLTDEHMAMLRELIAAADLMDEAFFRQVSHRNVQIRIDLERLEDPGKEDISHYFRIMYGPYDRLDKNRPFINLPRKLKGVTYYPANMDKAEFEKWIEEHPGDEEDFRGPFTVLTRTKEKRLAAVPYNEHYKEFLEPAAEHLRNAAAHADNASLKKFLLSRAGAFGSNDYFQSDMDWVNVKDHLIDVTIGPYEVYEDKFLGYKAAFEAYICIRDPEQSQQLETIKNYLPEMEANLPIPEEHQNKKRGKKSPVAVVDLIYSAGDARAGVQTLAFNLPNDEKVREHKDGGAKKVILRNMMNGKYTSVMNKIAPIVTAQEQVQKVTFEQFFNHTLMHEISHSLGPGTIVKGGEETEVSKEIKELYPTIEEAKADTLGMYNSIFLIEKGFFPAEVRENIFVTFMAGTFRSVRFGANEAHGKANVIIFNYLVEKGAYVKDDHERFKVDFEKVEAAVRDLAHDLLMIEALGDYDAAKAFIEKYGTMGKDMQALLDEVNEAHIPVDVEPIFDIDDLK